MTDDTHVALSGDATDDEIAAFINAALRTSDIKQISRAIGAATKLFSITELAELSDVKRESLHRAFAGGVKNANFTTAINVLRAMGFQLRVEPASGIKGARRSRLARQKVSDQFSQ